MRRVRIGLLPIHLLISGHRTSFSCLMVGAVATTLEFSWEKRNQSAQQATVPVLPTPCPDFIVIRLMPGVLRSFSMSLCQSSGEKRSACSQNSFGSFTQLGIAWLKRIASSGLIFIFTPRFPQARKIECHQVFIGTASKLILLKQESGKLRFNIGP